MTKDTQAEETNFMKLPELAQKAGLSGSTVYEYMRSGLLPPPVKNSPTKSFFTIDHLTRLKKIKDLRDKRHSITEIKAFLGCDIRKAQKTPDSPDSVKLEIIDKALELFSRHHYEKTRISDITRALNMGNGTFYRYFDSKEELFLECLKRLPFVLVPDDAWLEVEKETDFILRLKKRGYAMLNAFPSYIGILNYAKMALGGGDEVLAKKAAECIKTLVEPLIKDLKKAIHQGRVRNVDVELCGYLLLGINETFGYRTLIDPDYSVEYGFGVIEDFVDHALAAKKESQDKRHYSCELVDISENLIKLDFVLFNNSDFFSGHYLEGELKVPFKNIKLVSIVNDSGLISATINLLNNDNVTICCNEKDLIDGTASFGHFSIKAGDIQSVKIYPLTKA